MIGAGRAAAWLVGAALLGAGCSEDPPPPAAASATEPEPAYEDVVLSAIAALEAELATEPPEPPEDLEERLEGLLETLAGAQDSMRGVAREELAMIGDAATPLLTDMLDSFEVTDVRRQAAAEALSVLDTPAAAEALMTRLERGRFELDEHTWMRSVCAWRLGQTTQDQVVPRMVLCLKYEKNFETVVWIARTLAHFGNFAGLDGIAVVAGSDHDPIARDKAFQAMADLAAEHGTDFGELRRGWAEGRRDGPFAAEPSRHHELAIWVMIRRLSEWQLRGVDDARFALSRQGSAAAERLGAALADSDRYVRVHAGQCLERMGPRAAVAAEAIREALDDPDAGSVAAAALGAVGAPGAEEVLVRRLREGDRLEVRVAAARGLANARGLEASLETLAALVEAEDEPLELRAVAAQALAPTRASDDVEGPVALLVEMLRSNDVEPAAAERALERWLRARVAAGSELAAERLAAWSEAVSAAGPRERRARRAELLAGG